MKNLPMHVGSYWDCGSDNELQVTGHGAQPTEELIASGLPAEIHDQLGYRNVTAEEAKDLTGHSREGWIVPYCDPSGVPYQHDGKDFYRLKPAYPGKGAKYLTSSGAGCRPYWSPLLAESDNSRNRMFITEGEKKADALTFHGFPCVGLSGVSCWRDKRSGKSAPLPELENLLRCGRIYVLFDSDLAGNPSVLNELNGLCALSHEIGGHPYVVQLPFELAGKKNGADDFLKRHGKAELEKLIKIARPAGHCKGKRGDWVFDWTPEPTESHHIALQAASVFAGFYAVNPLLGVYKWNGRCYSSLKGYKRPLLHQLHYWMDLMQYERRAISHIASIEQELSTRLERKEWDPSHVMAFANGTLNVKTGELRAGHNPSDGLTFCLPYEYRLDAKCPTWDSFLRETFPDDKERILIRAAFKWTLFPKDPDAAFMFDLIYDFYGPRGCGKGTISEVIQGLVGGAAGTGILRASNLSNPKSLAGLIGKRIAIDPDASGHISDVGPLNSIASNEPVEVHVLYKNPFPIRLGVVIWRFFNDAPTVSGGSVEGLGRRMVTFRIQKAPARRDETLKSRLLKELPGIFMWAWSMSHSEMKAAFQSRGTIASVRNASVEVQLDADPTLRFVLETFPEGVEVILAGALYGRYKEWCQDNGHKPHTNANFGKQVKKAKGLVTALPRSSAGCRYEINPAKGFDLAAHYGIESSDLKSAGFNLASVHGLEPDYAPQYSLPCSDSRRSLQGLNSSHPSFFHGQGKRENRAVREEGRLNPAHPALTTCAERVRAAMDAGCTDEDSILNWCASQRLQLGRQECRITMRRLQRDGS